MGSGEGVQHSNSMSNLYSNLNVCALGGVGAGAFSLLPTWWLDIYVMLSRATRLTDLLLLRGLPVFIVHLKSWML